jgi:hypothetical protein
MTRLAARLAIGGGAEPLVRLVVTAIGLAAGVMLLIFGAVAFPALHAHEARAAWAATSAHNPRPARHPADASPVLWRAETDHFEGHSITRVDVAALGPHPLLPPGLARLPGPGQLAASPALARLLRGTPAAMLGNRYPARIVGSVGDAALIGPGQLVAVVGRDPAWLRSQPGVAEVHSIESAAVGANLAATGFLRIMVVIGIIGLLVPVGVFVTTATRLGAARREQRLAALRLAGATPRQTALIAAAETVLAAVAGTGLGFAAFAVARPYAARIPVDGYAFFPGDLRLSAGPAVLIAVGVPVLAGAAALLSLRRVQISPLGTARQAAPSRPTWRRLIPLAAGLAGFAGAMVLVATLTGSNIPLIAAALSFLVVITGIVAAGPLLTVVVARSMSRLGRRAPGLLAARHLQGNPGAGFRAISGLILATFVATVVSAVTPSALASSQRGYTPFPPGLVAQQFGAHLNVAPGPRAGGGRSVQPRGAAPGMLDPAEAARLGHELRAVHGVSRVIGLWLAPAGSVRLGAGTYNANNGLEPVVTGCAGLRAAHLATCPDPAATVAVDGSTLANGIPGGPSIILLRRIPAGALAALPLAGVIVATNGSNAAVERVRTILETGQAGRLGPAVTSADVNALDNQRLTRLEQLSNAALLLTLVIAGCSLAVAVAGGLIERRRPFALLRLTGMHRSELNRVVLAEAGLPLIGMTAVSVVLGLGVAAGLLAAIGETTTLTWRPPVPGYWAALAGGLVLAVAIVAATLPLLHRLTALDSARFE